MNNLETTTSPNPEIKIRRNSTSSKERWNERVIQISRVTKVCKGGKKLSFRAVIAIGNENGQVGVGIGKADDVINAITKATSSAKRRIIRVTLTKNATISHVATGIFGACKVLIKPATQGTGVIAGSSIRTVLELAGIRNILAKQLGSNNLLNNARATIVALESLKEPKMVANERNINIENLYS
uniref:Small ribosomal subunit protein uS5c n=1 Tax=Rhizochromulina marina TaxID=1034831 RepID=A0A514CPU3_9STRA|nr:ribosomal protein S5 [Rhizochromulina marina]QDH81826.1 ribosomal protein S5 [Rhizochromulina marina]